jgi:hypothetical protein
MFDHKILNDKYAITVSSKEELHNLINFFNEHAPTPEHIRHTTGHHDTHYSYYNFLSQTSFGNSWEYNDINFLGTSKDGEIRTILTYQQALKPLKWNLNLKELK